MTEVKELIKKRGSVKGRLTNFINYVNGLDGGELSPLQTTELKLRLSKVDQLLQQYDEIQNEIESTVDDKDISSQQSERQEFENLFYSIVARAQSMSKSNESDDDSDGGSSYVSGHSKPSAGAKHTKSGGSRGIKLPTIAVPEFSGQYEDWLEFRDTFVSLIHENNYISNIQKFHYLRASLKGGAAQVIGSLEFSSNNYVIAWDLLCDRFNNTRLLLQNHLQAIFSCEHMKRESSQSIRKIIDTFSKNLRSLQVLGEPTHSWDTLIIYIINTKLDQKTARDWEEKKTSLHNKITLTEFMSFLKGKADLLETLNMNNKFDKSKQHTEQVKGFAAIANTINYYRCPICKNEHRIYNCNTFLGQSVDERAESVRKLNLCTNCLRAGHQARVCRSRPCTLCSSKHNTLLHVKAIEPPPPPSGDDEATSLSVHVRERVLLSTAGLYIRDKDNQRHEVRAVLDSGSQASFMTEALHKKLKLKCTNTQTTVVGINNSISQITKRCNSSIESRVNPFKADVAFLVLPSIAKLCKNSTHMQKLSISSQIALADPEYYSPSSVDLLLGADIFWDLLEQGQIRLGANSPVLQQTKLGYIVSGPTSGLNQTRNNTRNIVTCNIVQNDLKDIQEQLSQFWSLEETPVSSETAYSSEERACEEHFVKNYTRLTDGRFSVAIPLKKPESVLGDSYSKAKHCFLSMERRLQRLPKLREMYIDFINEYKDLGHMTPTSGTRETNTQQSYFLPHHGVLRENSSTTKLRVVFNASASTSTGVSLNELQMVGPTVQNDLFSILVRFRHFTYVMTGDIEKMYRQVLVHPDQRHLQKIIWRDDPTKELQTFQLNTVTYGTASAPFLAIRCLKQLALECKDSLISQIIAADFYVDDLVTGSQSVQQLRHIRDEVCKVLFSGCFNLRKVKSNVENFTHTDSEPCVPLNFGQQNSANTLGLGWSSSQDDLYFSPKPPISAPPTKRSVLSKIGQIFDPLGLLSLVIIQAKIMLQKLWLLKISWDDTLPSDISETWRKFTSELSYLDSLRIPRCVTLNDPSIIELHTFCDSSQDAYGACVFVRSVSSGNEVQTHLLCAKSKVAPLKPVTIPRLELCGALVAARLTHKVLQAFRLPVTSCTFWTDSSIVLAWLKTTPYKLKQFVRNRVAEIQELTQTNEWRHVPTRQNPADLLTRGIHLSQLQNVDLWWTGPAFLRDSPENWPKSNFDHSVDILPEVFVQLVVPDSHMNNDLIDMGRFSSLLKLKRSLAYALRFVHNCRTRDIQLKISGPLSTAEMDNSFDILLKQSQRKSFENLEEFKSLQNNQTLPLKSTLLHLSPFIDDKGIIRVGGRLDNSSFDYDTKHPILISCQHHISKLIFTDEHKRLLHAGPQLLLSSVRQQFWPIGGRNMARLVAHKCQRCFRMRARTINPIMGQLPEERLSPGYAFQNTGVDYAGPLLAADRRGRGCKLIKVYIAVFVCFATKALHLELVTDLTKDAYIAALRRFIARRSKPRTMFSDNGTQFVGAKNEICKFISQNSAALSETMANDQVNFKFIPAYAPHFGGLWEAGVKSCKHHLIRVLGNSNLTFEELYTTLVQIEAILNSRPLSPISPDPSDLTPLTPGHFLVGRPLTALPSPRLENANWNRLGRWERVEQLRQHFWIRWQKEYVTELQQKTKWRTTKGRLDKGILVLVKEDNLPPMKWCLGRVQDVYTGSDGVGRVADILTSKGVIRRAFNKICPLPNEDDRS